MLDSIGAVADQLGVTTRTLRYYEELGLIQPTQRTTNGLRLYDDEARARVRLIRRAQSAGLSLETIRLVLDTFDTVADLEQQPPSSERLERIIADVRARHAEVLGRAAALADELTEVRALERRLAHDLELCEERLAQYRRAERQDGGVDGAAQRSSGPDARRQTGAAR